MLGEMDVLKHGPGLVCRPKSKDVAPNQRWQVSLPKLMSGFGHHQKNHFTLSFQLLSCSECVLTVSLTSLDTFVDMWGSFLGNIYSLDQEGSLRPLSQRPQSGAIDQ